MLSGIKDRSVWKTISEIYRKIKWKRNEKVRKKPKEEIFVFLNSSKQIIWGTSFLWLPLLGCYIAEFIINLVHKIG